MSPRFSSALVAALFTLAGSEASAADALSVEAGYGNKTEMVRIGAQWKWDKQWWKSEKWHLGGYWHLTASNWHATRFGEQQAAHENIFDVGVTPVFRYQRNDYRGWYGEFAIGLHLLSDYYDNNHRQLSTHFQFGDHVGLGYVFSSGIDLGLAYQHFSNGSIKRPNDGVNFTVLRLSYAFR
jgi:lipid A 3-O-deacylase